MTQPRWLNADERRAWLALLSINTLLPSALDTQLQSVGKLSLFDYNVLAMLSETEGRYLPMSELAARTSASLSRLSHVVTKLQKRGWVERQAHPGDARVTVAHLTEAGMSTIVSLAPGHVESVRTLMLDSLTPDDVADLARIGEKIVARLDNNHWILRTREGALWPRVLRWQTDGMDFSARYVALGDSFTEGVGDDDPHRPNGVRGWADVVAGQLASSNEDFGYANLAIRGRKLRQIMAEQVDAAIAMNPTLVTLYAGANDILRPKIDIDSLLEEYDAGIAKLSAAGATVVLFTGFDAKGSKVFSAMRGRTAIYNELVREIAENHGALLVDYWRFDEYDDWRLWGEDRMHMSTAGHVNMAKRVLDVLEHEHVIEVPELAPARLMNRVEALKANARWFRESAAPWVARRVRGVSSGDGLSPKYPELIRPL